MEDDILAFNKKEEARKKAHEYYMRNREKYLNRSKAREAADPERIRAYKAHYFQEVTKQRRAGKLALTPVRQQYSIRSDADHHTKQVIAPKSTTGVQELGPRLITFD
jgi:hypothetical protein